MSGFECYCQIILMTDASKMQGTAVQGIESPSVPGRIIKPENFPSPVEGNFPLLSDALPLLMYYLTSLQSKHVSYHHARIFGTTTEEKTALKKCYPYRAPAVTTPLTTGEGC